MELMKWSKFTTPIKLRYVTLQSSLSQRNKLKTQNTFDKSQWFTFDSVFGTEATQKDIFSEVNDLIISALDGYKVCIFAYGQTGSGKTYTMEGNYDDEEHKGIIPRSIESLLELIEKRK